MSSCRHVTRIYCEIRWIAVFRVEFDERSHASDDPSPIHVTSIYHSYHLYATLSDGVRTDLWSCVYAVVVSEYSAFTKVRKPDRRYHMSHINDTRPDREPK